MSREKLFFWTILAVFGVGCSTGAPPPAPAREAAPASFNSTPATKPLLVPATGTTAISREFDAQLIGLVNNEPRPATASAMAVAGDERQLIAAVIESLSRFRAALREENTTMAARVAPLLNLSDQIRAQTPLNVPTLAICRSVTQFGAYDEFDGARFTAGKETPTIVYCEVENFASQKKSDSGRWETKLSYEAVLYSGADDPSAPIVTRKPAAVVDECRIRRRDFFLADRLTFPASLAPGQYILKVTVIDQLANHVAEKTVPITIEAH